MSSSSISIEHISKRYRIGRIRPDYDTLRDRLSGMFRRAGRSTTEELWALRDVSLEIAPGEAVGLIGHNGAGKSTLLKILTRITEPTSGRIVLRGRVASLLEVGTGFHPELTGRENIFLNGAILGMTRPEIRRNFDAIAAFAEIEAFLDTPVKRYSSGMYVRLAFAVAAHLTPEILLIDEVLAVGDMEFQRRCLGRMNEVARSGRTVVFVSHNLDAIARLCSRAVLMSRGEVQAAGPVQSVLNAYLSRRGKGGVVDLSVVDRSGEGRARIKGFEILSVEGGRNLDELTLRRPFRIRLFFEAFEVLQGASFGIALLSNSGTRIFLSEAFDRGRTYDLAIGNGHVDCIVRDPNVVPGTYRFELWISDIPGVRATDHVATVGEIDVVPDPDSPPSVQYHAGAQGVVHVQTDWTSLYSNSDE